MAWVLLRGLTRDARHWGDFTAAFEDSMPGARTWCIDFPGVGQYAASPSPWTISGILEHCRRALRQRGANPPYRLLALSLGGMVAADWALHYPEEVSAAVLINTSLKPFSPVHRRLRWQAWPAVMRALMAGNNVARRERFVLDLTSNRSDQLRPLVQQWARFQREQPVSRATALRQLAAATAYQAAALAPACPVLVLSSLSDRLVHFSCSAEIARRWRAPCMFHELAGHDLPLDAPQWVIEHIANWAGTLPAPLNV